MIEYFLLFFLDLSSIFISRLQSDDLVAFHEQVTLAYSSTCFYISGYCLVFLFSNIDEFTTIISDTLQPTTLLQSLDSIYHILRLQLKFCCQILKQYNLSELNVFDELL